MAQIETWLKCDLKKPVKVQYLHGNLFSQDNQANLIGVELYDNGTAVTASGTVTANIIREDGATVTVTGTTSGNKASVVLPATAYAIPGAIAIVIKITLSGVITTIGAVVGTVYRSSTDTPVDPGTIMPSIQTLISQIQTAVASIPPDYSSLWTSLAPAFSASTNYAAGQYVTNNGKVYRFNTAHTAGAWVASEVTEVKLGNEISDLKSALSGGNTYESLRKKSNNDFDFEWAPVGLPTDEQTAEAISAWLDDHPEATTTVQDGSLTEAKFSNELKLKAIKDYVTPQMYGAVGDGYADDTVAIQNAINSGKTVFIPNGTYKITRSLYITTNGTRIIGENKVLTKIQKTGTTGCDFTRSHTLDENDSATAQGVTDFNNVNSIFSLIFPNDGNISYIYIGNLYLSNASEIISGRHISYSCFENIRTNGGCFGFFGGWVNYFKNINVFSAGVRSIRLNNASLMIFDMFTSNAGTFTVLKGTAIKLSGCAVDAGNPSYLLQNGSFTLNGCSCETYYECIRASNAFVALNGCDIEAHVSSGATFSAFLYITNGSEFHSNGTRYRYQNYYQDVPTPASIYFNINDSSTIEIDTDLVLIGNISPTILYKNQGTDYYTKYGNGNIATNRKGVASKQKFNGITLSSSDYVEIARVPIAYRNNKSVFIKGVGAYYDSEVLIDAKMALLCVASVVTSTIEDNTIFITNNFGSSYSLSFTAEYDNGYAIIKAKPSEATLDINGYVEWL